MKRIGVAATAPFGADVLERLAARHDVAFVLTRPDARAGRGRKVAAPAAKTDRPRAVASAAAGLLAAAAPAMRRHDLTAVVDVDPQSL